jgi:hypothetical protein
MASMREMLLMHINGFRPMVRRHHELHTRHRLSTQRRTTRTTKQISDRDHAALLIDAATTSRTAAENKPISIGATNRDPAELRPLDNAACSAISTASRDTNANASDNNSSGMHSTRFPSTTPNQPARVSPSTPALDAFGGKSTHGR